MILIENLYTMKVLYMRFIKALMEMDFSQQFHIDSVGNPSIEFEGHEGAVNSLS